MKILLLYDHPPTPGGLSSQGHLLYRGLREIGVDVAAVHFAANLEKEWYYRSFRPDVVVGVGYWGHTPHLVLHPQQHGLVAVPWLVADGYVANYRSVLSDLPLVLVTSNWVREVYIEDGIRGDHIEVLPVGCDTDAFAPRPSDDPAVVAVRETLGVPRDCILILTVGGDAASKGGHEVLQALARPNGTVPDWRYICKVWPQPRTYAQNVVDLELARQLGLGGRFRHVTEVCSREFVPYLLNACDIYAAPSRLEGFGMLHVEANACGKPVLSMDAMAMRDTLIQAQTAFLAGVAQEIRITETVVGSDAGYDAQHQIVFHQPRVVECRANVDELATYLHALMSDPHLRRQMGQAARERAVREFDYRVVARKLLDVLRERLGLGAGT